MAFPKGSTHTREEQPALAPLVDDALKARFEAPALPFDVTGGGEGAYEPDAPEDSGDTQEYPDWNETNSRVLSGPLGFQAKFPGRRFHHWQSARAFATDWTRTRGVKLYKFWTGPGRWYARVGRPENKENREDQTGTAAGPQGHAGG